MEDDVRLCDLDLCCISVLSTLSTAGFLTVVQYVAQARQDVQQLKSIAGTASKKLGDMASSFMRDLQGGY